MPARGRAEWRGGVRQGSGTFEVGDAISGAYSFATRFEDAPGANPEQLLAAAHAACFSMALSAALERSGTPVVSVRTEAVVTLRLVDGTPTITTIELRTTGNVPGIDEVAFKAAAEGAKVGCPVSRALAGVPEVTLEATLERAGA